MRLNLWWFSIGCVVINLVAMIGCSHKKDAVEMSPLQAISSSVALRKVWSKQIGSGFHDGYKVFQPALSNEKIIAIDARGLVLAFEQGSGKRHWKRRLKTPLSGGVFADENTVWVSTESGKLLALEAQTGATAWLADLGSEVVAPVSANHNYVVAQTVAGQLLCFTIADGKLVWVAETKEPVLTLRGTSSPQIVSGFVLAGFANGKLMVFKLDTGELVWEYQVGLTEGSSELDRLVDIDGQFYVEDSVVFVGSYQGRLSALNLATARPYWLRDISTYVSLTVELNHLIVSDVQGVVWSVDQETGVPIWKQDSLKARRLSGPAVLDDVVLIGDMEGYVHGLSVGDGHLIARTRLDKAPIRSVPIVSQDLAFILSSKGQLTAIQVESL